uniref:Protein kinase domain-containing protein n=1 Tax=Macrostomum lignano TaxID=282301 RepID=A0A1I8ILK2_9PLAT
AALYAPKETAVQVSQILLDAGSDWSLKDSCSKTALDLIRSDGNPDLVELLQKHEDPPFMERWDVGDLIGRGGFGEVYKVLTDKGIQCVAKIIKLPVGQLTADQYAHDRTKIDKAVESERNLCRLQHRNIVRFFHIAQTEPATIVLFMELLEGKTLETFINGAPMPENKIRDFSEQRAALHAQPTPPVIHRDINCSNIMVLSEGTRIKLIDFGLSIELKLSVSHNLASTQTPRGTHNFMAPELLGAGEADTSPQYSRESDIWAFGCSVYQMATRQRPFHSASNLLTIAQLIKNNGCPKLPPGCSKELEDFYRSCTTQNRSKRQSALELMRHQFLTGGEITRMRLMTNRLHRAASIS